MVHEREDPRLLFLRLLDHDADSEVHERLAEVNDALSHRRDRHGSNRNIGHLRQHIAIVTNLPPTRTNTRWSEKVSIKPNNTK